MLLSSSTEEEEEEQPAGRYLPVTSSSTSSSTSSPAPVPNDQEEFEVVVSEESRSSEGHGSGRVLSLDEEDEDLRNFSHLPCVVGSSERYLLSMTIIETTTATPVSSVLEELDFALPSPSVEESEGDVMPEEEVTFPGEFDGGDVEVAVEDRRRRRRSRLGRGGRSSRGRRPRRNAVIEEEQVQEEFVLPPESEDEDPQASLPPRPLFTREPQDYVLFSDDYLSVFNWLRSWPRFGHSYHERAIRGAINPAAIDGGNTFYCSGRSAAEIGPLRRNARREILNFDAEVEEISRNVEGRQDWRGTRLSDLLPRRFSCLFAVYDGDRVSRPGFGQSPRSVWRSEVLPRTSSMRCVGCLARDLTFRQREQGTITHYVNCVRQGDMRRWARMRSSTRTLVFRCHSCYYAELRPLVWHGIITANQANLSAGVAGWIATFRVYVTAYVPSSHSEMYLRGTIRISVTFRLPPVYRVLLGEEISMRGHLVWEGTRASRGQSTCLFWVPYEGDGEGLTGPMRRAQWSFVSDFSYGDRPDVLVTALSIQLHDIEPNAGGSRLAERTEQARMMSRRMEEARVSRNTRRVW